MVVSAGLREEVRCESGVNPGLSEPWLIRSLSRTMGLRSLLHWQWLQEQ